MLQIKRIVKRFGDNEVVKRIDLEVQKGDSFGLLGPNGAGKSTTIAMIAGLIAPTSGEIYVGGINVANEPKRAKAIMGIVPQEIALYPTLSARENLNFWGAMYGLAGRELHSRVDEALEIVSLADRQKERIETFSGGMKRRINIAASLLHRPQLLIMDEPTVGIDPQSRNNILESVKRLNQERQMTIVYTSHYMEEVQYLCQRLAIIDHGQVIARGTLDEVRQLIGSQSTIRLRLSDATEALTKALAQLPGVTQVRAEEQALIAIVNDPAETLPRLLGAVASSGLRLLGVEIEEPNLEAVFLHLTGRTLRD